MANARHSKAGRFVQQRLFAGLSAFVELERRIADLPDKKSRGDAFEVFTEAYLATQRKHDAETVWPLPSVPTVILGNLQLATQDYGVDGVLKSRLGNFSAYQVKFRTGRPALTWRKLSTFMGLADSPTIHSRILLTNCDELPSVLNDRQGFFCIRGSDLDRLEADDFKAIEAWLADSAYQAPKKTPQPHQAEALEKILPAFNEHDRVSAIMACGTGKTLVALWVAEKMQASGILVLVPSLALLRQILHEWLSETNLPALAYLCVCSDPTVKEGLDAIDTKQSDLDFQVSTDAASVREFLDASFAGVKIIFSTYQSAQVVGAALKPGETFDLAVFDEAHKTAGREGRNYGFALEDANLPIRKRLFLTATPRHYNPHQRDREGEARLLFSMDNPEVYGPQAYRLTFAEAACRGIICGYKVIISVITSEMVTNELLSRGEVVVNGDAVRARQVANQIALRDVIEKYGASKVFTFHKTVVSAASFVADGSEGIRTHLPEFGTFHVNGKMPTARREHEMRDFRAAARAVMSNARCLTEGVDVPAVDMVAFLSPRRSRVDIVQATGRAMRRSPGKTTGYVLVPLYVEFAAGETVDAAVNRADFDEVWDVLQSLQEQDDVLAEIIREMREERGRTKGFDDSRFSERVEILGPQVGLEALCMAITTECIERLGASWEERFGELKAFKACFDHCNVKYNWTDNPSLFGWANNQRRFRKTNRLSAIRIQRLTDIGFIFDPQEAAWEEMFHALTDYKRVNDDCNVPRYWPRNQQLSGWVTKQRSNQREGRLTKERVERLNAIGFMWEPADSRWEENFQGVVQFQRTNGAAWIRLIRREAHSLATWLSTQRHFRRKGMLSEERIRRLEEIGIQWDAIDSAWEEMYSALCEFKRNRGNCLVPTKWPEKPRLRQWITVQRSFKRQNRLSADRVRRLEEIGFIWDPHEAAWEEMFQELLNYKSVNGDCHVPLCWQGNPTLATWVGVQRQKRNRNQLREDRRRRLDAVEFLWTPHEDAWEGKFTELTTYRNECGHCNVPADDPKLGRWVHTQRVAYKSGTLSTDRMRRLEVIGFRWDPYADWWEEWFGNIVQFKAKHGHCDVSRNDPDYAELASWINSQRTDCRKGKVSADRVRRLTELGLSWNPKTDLWEDQFSELVEFKNEHGDCLVPSALPKYRKLSTWVNTQRNFKKKEKLALERIQRLDKLGMVWNSKDAAWETMFAELLKYWKVHKHCDVPQGWPENRKLGRWVNTQRLFRRQSKLSRLTPERIKRLDELGFQWEMKSSKGFHPTVKARTSS